MHFYIEWLENHEDSQSEVNVLNDTSNIQRQIEQELLNLIETCSQYLNSIQFLPSAYIDDKQNKVIISDEPIDTKESGNHVNHFYLELIAGSGGTESCDFVHILSKMYCQYLNGFDNIAVEIADIDEHEQAGYKSIILEIFEKPKQKRKGGNQTIDLNALFKALQSKEAGIHKLIRNSPFDAKNKRHTSFCGVHVYPQVDEESLTLCHIRKDDIEVQTMRSSGAGGQHVNRTESAVRMKHIPTGIVVTVRSGRCQHSNRKTALNKLLAKLIEHRQNNNGSSKQKFAHNELGFGHAKRTYHFVNQMVVDEDNGQTVKFPLKTFLNGGKAFQTHLNITV